MARVIRAALYLRVSTADQGRRGFSLPEQKRACQERAEALCRAALPEGPVRLETAEFVDMAGGDLLERPDLDRARRYVREVRPDFFICLDPDRFSRSAQHAILVANEIEEAGTRLEFVQHDYQTTSEGRLFFTLRVAIAEYEKAKILERTSRGKRGKLAGGGIPHRIRAYGYDFAGGQLAVNEQEARWVREIFAWAAGEGLGSQRIAERLNALQVPAKLGGRWHRSVVADLLHNPIYVGRLRLNRYDFTGLGGQLQLPRERRTKKLTPRQRPEAEWVTLPVPAIVSAELFARVQAGRRAVRRSSRGAHLLSGLAVCGLCGAPMHYVRGKAHFLLRCANRYPAGGGARCHNPHQRAGPVEAQVRAVVRGWLLEPDLLREASGALPAGERVGRLKEAQAQILALLARGLVAYPVAEEQLTGLQREMDSLLQQEQACPGEGEWAAWLGALAPQQEQQLVRLLCRQVRVFLGGRGECVPGGSHHPGQSPLQPPVER